MRDDHVVLHYYSPSLMHSSWRKKIFNNGPFVLTVMAASIFPVDAIMSYRATDDPKQIFQWTDMLAIDFGLSLIPLVCFAWLIVLSCISGAKLISLVTMIADIVLVALFVFMALGGAQHIL